MDDEAVFGVLEDGDLGTRPTSTEDEDVGACMMRLLKKYNGGCEKCFENVMPCHSTSKDSVRAVRKQPKAPPRKRPRRPDDCKPKIRCKGAMGEHTGASRFLQNQLLETYTWSPLSSRFQELSWRPTAAAPPDRSTRRDPAPATPTPGAGQFDLDKSQDRDESPHRAENEGPRVPSLSIALVQGAMRLCGRAALRVRRNGPHQDPRTTETL